MTKNKEKKQKKQKKQKKKKKQHRFFWFMVKFQIVLLLIILSALGIYFFGGYADELQELKKEAVTLVSESNEKTFIPGQTSSIYDSSGNIITETSTGKSTDYVEFADIPTDFVTAIISIEDKKFYSHNGIDYKAAVRAAKAMIENGRITEGGSTITMQLAKLTYMEPSRTWQYKVQQMFLALELEKRYSKNKIMEFYLNNIYFANGYYGIKAACHGYFNCELNELDLSQIAFLCAIPNSPTYYDPVVNIENTLKRRDRILKNMLDDGKITQQQYDDAVAEEIVLNRPKKTTEKINNYVDTYVYSCAVKALMEQQGFTIQYYFDSEEEEQEYDEEYSQLYTECQKKIHSGGYKIYTSIDMEKQELLQEAVDKELAGFQEVSEDGTYTMQGSAVCIDNETGFVVAIVGGRDQNFSTYTLNRAYQSYRQPGSSIKPLVVYTPLFERDYTPDSLVLDEKFEGGPSNYPDIYYGEVTIRTAVAKSLNTVAWKLYEELTPEVGLSYLKEMNFSHIVEEDYVPATSIGGFTKGVSALEMASAYAALENDGVYRKPTCIMMITDSDDKVIYVSGNTEKQVYTETAARIMTDVLTTVMESGTGKSLALNNMPSAGKSGTTNDQKDGWFVGYTRYYTTSVWIGYDLPKKVEGLTGSSYPGQIWKNYMNQIHEGLKPLEFLPYAQLSQEFQNQQEQEREEQQRKRDEFSLTYQEGVGNDTDDHQTADAALDNDEDYDENHDEEQEPGQEPAGNTGAAEEVLPDDGVTNDAEDLDDPGEQDNIAEDGGAEDALDVRTDDIE